MKPFISFGKSISFKSVFYIRSLNYQTVVLLHIGYQHQIHSKATSKISYSHMTKQQQSIARFFSKKVAVAPATELSSTKVDDEGLQRKKRSRSPSPGRSSKARIIQDSEDNSMVAKPVNFEAKTKSEPMSEIVMKSDDKPINDTLIISNSKYIFYKSLCEVFEEIENESSRLKIIDIISAFFKKIIESGSSNAVKTLVEVVYLSINRLGPDYESNLELGLGETLLIKSISESTGRSTGNIKSEYVKLGDLGKIAMSSRSKQSLMFKPKPLTVDVVFSNLTEIAKSTGNSSQNKKIGIIVKMLSSCSSVEAKFLIRSLEGKLRIGLADKSILTALARSILQFQSKSNKIAPEIVSKAENLLKDAFNQVSNYEIIVSSALEHGIMNLKDHIALTPGIPLKPMLAKPTKAITEILDKFSGTLFTCEYKYDGERAQIHLLNNGAIKIYSRNSEDMTQRYPDLIETLKHFIKPEANVKSLILDTEAVAWDRTEKKILPFQVLTTRKRKDVKLEDIKVQICIFAFDILCINDEPLIQKSFKERRKIMFDNLNILPGQFDFAIHRNLDNIEDIQHFLDQSIKDSCEGLMVKSLEGTYEPSQRSSNWLKLKKDYLQGIGDSIDLVVLGGYYGKGKRTGFYGGFLLGCYNAETGEYETTCKIGTGFSDQDLKDLYEKLFQKVLAEPKTYYVYDTDNSNSKPDVWFEPTLVFEVLTADLSLSPVYKAGSASMESSKGISLRFPRFLRVRDDKGPEDATNSDQLIELYENQINV